MHPLGATFLAEQTGIPCVIVIAVVVPARTAAAGVAGVVGGGAGAVAAIATVVAMIVVAVASQDNCKLYSTRLATVVVGLENRKP